MKKTKLDKRNTATSKKFDDDVIDIFQFMDNLEQFGSWIPHAWFAKITFSLKVTSPLTKTETKLKNL